MRTLSRAGINEPAELTSAECLAHRDTIIANPSTTVNPNYYKGKVQDANGIVTFTVREALKAIYKNKCAYCEKLAHQPKIDHHRPKGTVVGLPRTTHGYYWLCYEWSNLLPCCTDCNAIDAKSSRYPVTGVRNLIPPVTGNPATTDYSRFIYNDGFNTQEQPSLLHPEYCDPNIHFSFDLHGRIIGITNEGLATVATVKLDNPDLNGWRRAIYNHKLDNLSLLMRWYFDSDSQVVRDEVKSMMAKWLVNLVRDAENEELEYTLFRKKLLTDFDRFFINVLDVQFRQLMTDIFLEYIAAVT